ncbi:Carboxypeptidase S1-like protein B [Diplodia seriata]|uniref:Carboxypeptidase S1-like protein B n=1 Tax=Diplodia seriata TaxID=420778 RepID=A0A1S8BM95_9PEZI|nr:Carboxypeptidase S1-like protein B [Diplodia seriata]
MHVFNIVAVALALNCRTIHSWRTEKRQLPKNPSGVTELTSPQGAKVTYKQPGKHGICETQPNVEDYAGYVSLDNKTNMFFWYFAARDDPKNKPMTLYAPSTSKHLFAANSDVSWLNGGPGSDSLIGLFLENGPCNVTEDLKTQWNPYSWNEVSNVLYLSQPVGVGFSYESTADGSYDNSTGDVSPASNDDPEGRWAQVDPDRTNTTEIAAEGAWHIIQALLGVAEDSGDTRLSNRTFNLWTQQYGGHYGPTFYRYFNDQNNAIWNGSTSGYPMTMETLGIISGLIDERVQTPYYPEFATNNTYGIKAVNDTIYKFMKQAYSKPGGCRAQLDECAAGLAADPTDRDTYRFCSTAATSCYNFVEEPYYDYSGRAPQDIRQLAADFQLPTYYLDFLALPSTQAALGVRINYTHTNPNITLGFTRTGDAAYPYFKADLETLLRAGVRVVLSHGDADYVANWLGGEAVALALDYGAAARFTAAAYAPFVVDGVERGEVREAGGLSFVKVYGAGHLVTRDQPRAALELFRRAVGGWDIATGRERVGAGV